MNSNYSNELVTTINSLLVAGDGLLLVASDLTILDIWNREGADYQPSNYGRAGQKLNETENYSLLSQFAAHVENAFATRKRYQVEIRDHKDKQKIFGIKMLFLHPDSDKVFILIEQLQCTPLPELLEDKWKLVLDAVGDGMWDLDIKTGKMHFSKKWHEIFGYGEGEIITLEDWTSKIYPSDYSIVEQNFLKHMHGEAPIYSTEIRYQCKDGSYKWILSRGVIVVRTAGGVPVRFIGTHTDINERKIEQEKYYASAQLLSKLVNNLQNGILVTDEEQKIIFANQMFCDLHGIEMSPEQLTGLNMDYIYDSERLAYVDGESYYYKATRVLEKKEVLLNEELFLVSGTILSRDYLPLSLGRMDKGAIWKYRDITSQRNVEKRFEEQRLFYERILNGIAADIAVFDDAQRFLFVNPKAIKDPYLRKWLIGKTNEDYCKFKNLPLSIAEKRNEYFLTAKRERGMVNWEEKLESPDGDSVYQLRCLFPVFKESGDLDLMIGYGLDITPRILAEQELKMSLDTFANSFNYSGIGKALVGLDGNWLQVNDKLSTLTGYAKEELYAMTVDALTYPVDVGIDAAQLAGLLNQEFPAYTIEKRFVSKTRHVVTTSLTVTLIWNSDGTPKYFICDIVDITRQKELLEEIYVKNAELENTATSLSNKIAQLEELNHIIAHNLRGPASNIRVMAEMIINKVTEENTHNVEASDKDDSMEELGLILQSSESLITSLETLMEITQIKLNSSIPFNDCNIEELVQSITSQLRNIIFEKQANIIIQLGVETISYPRPYLESILYNFISNALKYSLGNRAPEIVITTTDIDGRVCLSVKDNGIGIDLTKYGSRVFKLNQVFHRGYDSKGVGLYLTKTQVEALGGTIELKSKVDEGSEFIVYF